MDERWIGSVPVIALAGSFLGDPEVSAFRDRIQAYKSLGSNSLVVDLGRVNFIGSAGIGALVGSAKTLREVGGDITLANLTERTYNVLVVVSRLDQVFNIYDSAEDAAASFREEL